jgi:cytochrome c5
LLIIDPQGKRMSAPSPEKSSHPIKDTIKFSIVIGVFSIALIIGIFLLVNYAVNAYSGRSLSGDPTMSDKEVAARLKPVGDLVVADPNAPLKTGEQVYTATCASCHGTGLAGAPKFGDKASWSSRLSLGFDKLVENANKGIRAMPAKGGNTDLHDIEVARAVAYMGNSVGANYKEPAEPVKSAVTAQSSVDQATPAVPQPTADATTPSATTSVAPAPDEQAKPAVTDKPDPAKGKAVYESSCVACHGAGIAGAPKFGDTAAWGPRVAQGAPKLHEHAIKGYQGKAGMMPAKGGNSSLSDADVIAAVDYIVSKSH